MSRDLPVITCTGRELDRHGRPVGEPCGRRHVGRPVLVVDGDDFRYHGWFSRPITPEEHAARARAAGWRLGPIRADGTRDAMCRRCALPDPATAAICRDLQKGLTRP